jgi:hypothetical protein
MARNTGQKKIFRALPQDFSQLGQVDTVNDIFRMPFNVFPTVVVWEETLCLPLTDAQVDAFLSRLRFGLFKVNFPNDDCPGITTTASFLTTIQPVVICGICVVAIGEGLNFCQGGVLVDCPDGNQPQQLPPVLANACDVSNAIPQEGQVPAIFQFGGPTWSFIESFFRAFSLQVLLNDECLIIDLPVNEIGMCEIAPSFIGAGDSCVSVMPFIREANQFALNNGVGCQFLPPNTMVTTGCDGVCTSITAPPPSAGATFGHIKFQGRHTKGIRLPRPLLLVPAVSTLGLEFDDWGNNAAFICQMKAAVVAGTGCLGARECEPIQPSPCFTGAALAASECPPILGGAAHFPGGKVTIGVRLMGFRVSYSFCLNYFTWLAAQSWPNLASITNMYQPFLQGLVAKMNPKDQHYSTIAGLASGNLSGLPGLQG